ncbi:MAG: hypothetical protein M3308_07495 [Actinomycetota bacterium]|nr:hypothetical protein [Actinomycetota bacterium]
MSPAPHIRIWRQPDGWWRWCYVEPGRDGAAEFTLPSNHRYDNAEHARAAAEVAYPGVAVEQAGPDETQEPAKRPDETGQGGGRRDGGRQVAPRWSYRHALWLVVVTAVFLYLVLRWRQRA